jgi:hypothetical protein
MIHKKNNCCICAGQPTKKTLKPHPDLGTQKNSPFNRASEVSLLFSMVMVGSPHHIPISWDYNHNHETVAVKINVDSVMSTVL